MIYAKANLSDEERKLYQSYVISRQIKRGKQESIERFLFYLEEYNIVYVKEDNADNIIDIKDSVCFCSIIGNTPTTPWTIGRRHITNPVVQWYILLRITESGDDFYVYIVEKEGMKKVLDAHEARRRMELRQNLKNPRETFNILEENTFSKSTAVINRMYVNELETLSCSRAADWIMANL